MDNVDDIKAANSPNISFERNLLTVAAGGGIIYAGQLFLSLFRLITVFLLARILNAEQYGLYNLALSTANVAVGIALLGLDSAMIRFVAIFTSRRDEAGLSGALQIGIGFSTFLSVLVSTGLFALAYPVSEHVFHKPELAPLLQVVTLIVPFLVLSEVLAGASRGFKKMHHVVIAQDIIQPVFRFILIVLLSQTGLNAMWAIITFGLADGLASLLLLFFLNRQFSLKRSIVITNRDIQNVLNYSIPVWLTSLLVTFRGNIQTILLGLFNTIASVGIFGVVSQVTMVSQMFFQSIVVSVKPMIAELHDKGDYEQLGRLFQTTTKWVIMANLPWFLLLVLFPVPILSIFGESYVNGANALKILAWASLVNVGTGTGGSIVDMTGYTKLNLINTIIRLVLSISTNYLLIPIWGILGAAFAALSVEVIVNFVILLEIWILFRIIPYNKSFFNPLIAGLAAYAVTFFTNHLLPVQEKLFYAVFSLTFMMIIYVAVTLGLGLAPEDRLLLSRFRQKVLYTRSPFTNKGEVDKG